MIVGIEGRKCARKGVVAQRLNGGAKNSNCVDMNSDARLYCLEHFGWIVNGVPSEVSRESRRRRSRAKIGRRKGLDKLRYRYREEAPNVEDRRR